MSDVTSDTEELAERYDRISNAQYTLGLHLVERMDVKEGEVILDIGCGTGRLALSVSNSVGPSGKVVGVDPSPHRIEVASRKLSDGTSSNLQFSIGAAEDLGQFPNASFDGVYLSSVLHWVRDKDRALEEAHRVLRPGGRIGITMPAPGSMAILRAAIVRVASRPPYASHVDRTVRNSKIDAEKLGSLLVQAGFCKPSVEVREKKRLHPSAEDLMEFYDASSFGNFLRFMPPDLRECLKADVVQELEGGRAAEGIELISRTIIATAKKPPQDQNGAPP